MGAFDDLLAEVGIRSAAQSYADVAPAPRRPMPRSMRPPEQRAVDPQIAATERARAMRQMRTSRAAELDTQQRQAFAPPRNQIAEAGQMALETTGIPGAYRANVALNEGDYGRFGGEAALGALNLLGTASAFMPMRGMRTPVRPPQTQTRIYRGINRPYDADRAARLGDRWWHSDPAVASTYAPGAEGAHVIPGVVDESALRLAHIQTPPGTMRRAIPVQSFPRDIRKAFPRGTTHVSSQEASSAAEAAGYDGITFAGMRDSGFAGAIKGEYPGFGTGDQGRVFALFNNEAVRSPFPAQSIAEAPQQLWRGIGSPERRTPWATTSREAASDYANEGAMGIRDPNNRAPFVERVDQRPSNPLHVSNIGDLRTALGRDARRLLGKTDGDQPWEHLDSRRVQDALRQRGFDAVVLRDDFSPNGTRHDSYLFLKEAPPPIAEAPARLPASPPREIGRASDGSVMPIRPAQPFRQSLVGGSEDLREAAGMGVVQRQAPQPARYEFDVDGRLADVRINHDGDMDFGLSDGWGNLSGSSTLRLVRSVERAIEQDQAAFARAGYTITPLDSQRLRIFEMMAARRGWEITPIGRGQYRLAPPRKPRQ